MIFNSGAGSTVDIGGSVRLSADGSGGDSSGGGTGGNGFGGQAFILAINGSSTVNIDGTTFVSAEGFGGGVGGDCQADCGVTGGHGGNDPDVGARGGLRRRRS